MLTNYNDLKLSIYNEIIRTIQQDEDLTRVLENYLFIYPEDILEESLKDSLYKIGMRASIIAATLGAANVAKAKSSDDYNKIYNEVQQQVGYELQGQDKIVIDRKIYEEGSKIFLSLN